MSFLPVLLYSNIKCRCDKDSTTLLKLYKYDYYYQLL